MDSIEQSFCAEISVDYTQEWRYDSVGCCVTIQSNDIGGLDEHWCVLVDIVDHNGHVCCAREGRVVAINGLNFQKVKVVVQVIDAKGFRHSNLTCHLIYFKEIASRDLTISEVSIGAHICIFSYNC